MPPSVFVIRVKQPSITYAHCDHFDRTYTATLLSTGATNLLSGNNATFETGIGSWVADTATAPSSRATLFTGGISHSGSNSMRADNNNGSGNCRVQYPTGLIAASPGDYHWFQCWGYDEDNIWGRMAMLEYLDSSGTILASSGTVYPAGSAGVWRALSHWNRTPAPAGTAWVRPVFFFSASTGGYYTMVDDAEVRTAVVDQSATLDSPWVVQSGTWKVLSPGKADASAVSGGTLPFGLSSRAFARYPVGVGPIDLSVAWAKASSAMAGTNLLTRNQFGLEGGPGGWQGYDIDPVIAASTDYAYSGTYSLRVGSTTGSGSPGATTLTGTSGFPVTPGRSYGASFRARANYALGVLTSIRWWNSSGTQIGSEVVGNPTSAYPRGGVSQTSWGSYYDDTMLFTAPSGAAFASLQLNLTNSNVASASLCYFDEIGMYDLTTPTMLFNSTVISSDRSIVFAYDSSSDTGFSLDANDIPESAWPTVANTVRAFTDGTTTRVLSYKLTTGTKIVNLRCTGSGYDHYTYYVSGDVSGGRAIFESSAYVPSHTDVAGTTTSSFGVYLRDLNGNFLGSGSIQDSVIQPSYTSTINLTQHNGSTATTLATATVTSFTSATFEIVYDDGPGTIVVKQNGSTIISIDLDTVAGGPYPHMTGGWAGLMTDAANADQWDEFCWTML